MITWRTESSGRSEVAYETSCGKFVVWLLGKTPSESFLLQLEEQGGRGTGLPSHYVQDATSAVGVTTLARWQAAAARLCSPSQLILGLLDERRKLIGQLAGVAVQFQEPVDRSAKLVLGPQLLESR